MPKHSEGWEVTPLRGQIEKLLDFLVTDAPWTLAPLE